MAQHQEAKTPHSKWIWPFELVEQIGEGGMGQVYKARYVVNGRFVALKMLPADVNDATALARFEREVAVLKNLKHPNIVRCFGGVCENKRRFYAMELLEGGTLEDKLQAKGKLPWEQVVEYGLQICAGLQCLHEQGVVHRDVKPSNFLLSPQGQLKLSDFGLASVAASRKITAAGKTAGTFLYMAPEQIRGKNVTSRTDLYALGCMIYELIAGVPPFVGDTPAATLHLHCNAPVPRLTEKAFDCPVALERIVDKLLEKDPENRYDTATDVARELRGVSQTVSATGRDLVKAAIQLADSGPQRQIKPLSNIQAPKIPSDAGWKVAGALTLVLLLSVLLNMIQWGQGRAAAEWESMWLQASQLPDPSIRIHAYHVLGETADISEKGLERLGMGLTDSESTVRQAAIQGIGKAGARGKPFLTQLINIQKSDAEPQLRSDAEKVVTRLQQAQEESWLSAGWLIAFGVLGAAVAGWWLTRRTTPMPEPEPAETREHPSSVGLSGRTSRVGI